MIIKKLELQGFKSFPERTKIVFHPGITAIVGPNGTGKSNIVDGILWVLGGQRHKGLRGEKTEDIIFNGNAKKPPLGMADVSLALQHGEEEIQINHRVFRSGESEYRLNGKPCRLKDIQDILWKRAVAEKEYFIIEQGAVGSVLTAKPLEKRLLVEEAAGIAFYKDKKKEAQSKLASSEQNLVRLEDIISEVGRAKNSLQRQAQAAARYRKLREKIRELAGFNFRRKLESLERRHGEATMKHAEGLAREQEISLRIKSEEQEIARRRLELWELEKAIKEDREALLALSSELNRALSDRERESRRIELQDERAKKSAAGVEELDRELGLLISSREALASRAVDLASSLETIRAELAQTTEDSRRILDLSSQREKNLKELKNKELETLSAMAELHNEKARTEKEIELLGRQEEKLRNQLEQENALLREVEETLSRQEKDSAALETARSEIERAAGEVRRMIQEKERQMEERRSRLEALSKSKEEDQHRFKALERILKSRQNAVAGEEIPETLGRLAELIEADPDAASLMDSLWREESGAAVIPALEFLRHAEKAGLRGAFFLLPPEGEDDSAAVEIRSPQILGRLKSRLKPATKFGGSLSRLNDALIVEDARTAIELWLHHPGLNFVTLNGDCLLSSGLLKLGRNEEGAFLLSQELKKLREAIDRGEAEIAPLSLELEALSREKENLERERLRLKDQADDIDSRIEEIEKQKTRLLTEQQKARASVSLFLQELDILGKDKDFLGKKMDSLVSEIASLEEKNQAVRAQLEAGEREFLAHRSRKVEKEKRLLELRADLALAEERQQNTARQVEELGVRIGHLEKRRQTLKDEMETALSESERARQAERELSEKARRLEEERQKKQTALAQKESDLQSQHSEEQEQEKRLAGLREELGRRKEERVRWEIVRAEIDRDMVNLEEACWQELRKTLHELKAELPESGPTEAEIEDELSQAEEELQKYKSVNLLAEEEYLSHKERYDFLIKQKNDLRESIDATEEAIRRIDEESKAQFLAALAEINTAFADVFTALFKGGSAAIKLSDEHNPMESGIEIIAQPPGKRVQNIALLSGGEKSLTSLAFLFALFRYKPTPFCILDEVDAALDDINLTRFLDLMKEIKKTTQFIIITHNYKTMEVADYIYGTTMAEPNFTTLYSVKLEKQQEFIS